jgi:CRP-like cAMP-binding protein
MVVAKRGFRNARCLPVRATLCKQGEEGSELYLLLDGVLEVWVNGELTAEVGPGAVLGERALLEGGHRTSTLIARTPCRVASAAWQDIDRAKLEALSMGHRREQG